MCRLKYPGVAQLVARQFWELDAAGSNPVTSTNKETPFVYQKAFLCLSKPQAWYIITDGMCVHIISPKGCISSRVSVYSPAA